MLEDGLGLPPKEFRGIRWWESGIEDLLDRHLDLCTGLLTLPPVEDELPFFQSVEEVAGRFLDLFPVLRIQVRLGLRKDVEYGQLLLRELLCYSAFVVETSDEHAIYGAGGAGTARSGDPGSAPRIVTSDPALVGPRGIGLVFAELGATKAVIARRLQACWRYAVKAAKVPHYRFHDLRHTYGTLLRREGRTYSDIAPIMGITEAMAHVYAHEDAERIQRDAIRPVTILSRLAPSGGA